MGAARLAQQRAGETRVVEDRIDPLVGDARLDRGGIVTVLGREQPGRELRVIARQTMAGVGENHLSLPPVQSSYTATFDSALSPASRLTKIGSTPAGTVPARTNGCPL